MTPATIVHLDADAFFVSVELAQRPELRGKRVAVGGRQRGIISSASYEARAVGVYTPMPSQRALKVCPDLILLPHEGDYGGVSRRMFDLCEEVTPLVQRNSIDEGYLDLSPCGLRDAAAVEARVRQLQQRIWDVLQIPVSMGIATNRLVSQIASKLRKPRGFVVVAPGDEAAFLAPLDIGEMPGIGRKTQPRLAARGIHTIGDVLTRSDDELAACFGNGWREFRQRCAGHDERAVQPDHEDAKSYSQQETFGTNIVELDAITNVAKGMIDHLMPKVRADGKRVRTLTLKVRYADFTQESAGKSLPLASDLEGDFYALLTPLITKAWTQRRRALRLISVKFSGVDDGPVQMEIFDENAAKRRRLAGLLDQLNAGKTGATVRHGHQLETPTAGRRRGLARPPDERRSG
ncbi:Y-family DNA polymerase [Synoicihabitans lomoniglobus]|uniref:DNA polymerase IV n=1 Tax=Synoicihabitans lomoniglobus TaxID=2909285 RepID=A0AAF0CQY2_9BACT|nr:DNA polymerase IV [Opitutaceae bacterium LMO-M01]WED66438.1 DNA polymerase IV [Opitutaceae bacterium LMO-M01]